ncbi:MAG: ATP synthase F1 subunit delta [Flavobacteriaceae bacterium]|nr:MAG: ATP synthase F1 subunit delta [Flavobacteriaceae bacterium]
MSETRAAIRYAKAMLSFAQDKQNEDAVFDDMSLVIATVDQTVELKQLLSSPVVKSDVKQNILTKIFGESTTEVTASLIQLLIKNKRLPILQEVAKQYIVLFDRLKGKEVAIVTTAIPLTDALNTQVLAKVKEITGKEAMIKNTIDPTIIGGFILRIGDVQYDASIANKLSALKQEFTQN